MNILSFEVPTKRGHSQLPKSLFAGVVMPDDER